ncbi:hypothetical protein BO70DRAFT_363298 [Aspergillus heteromorphus CBS 117.55]|uniref:Uncharacterized protein n=1 Tax=Aspergillus heteromorphus CBS 117.55 TaxID=1448321 RepID=A0A317VVH9_9EURO|nr:uncharacterized protein BO70DRAFT_363298 [Aspergillus heteromorphus CBS 117.55]PWY77361.1 hypothetical protein BO70DRAFT_363298 [Aspergillus heteromorphus CBS 117.55]
MEDASDGKGAALSLDNNTNNDQLSGRVRSGSASSGHKRSSSGSLLSRLSFLRMIQATQNTPERNHSGIEPDDSGDFGTGLRGGRAMSNAIQQHRRTRRRRGSLRKTALLGTRLDYRDKKPARLPADALRPDVTGQRSSPSPLPSDSQIRSLTDSTSPDDEPVAHRSSAQQEQAGNAGWTLMDAPQRTRAATASSHRQQQSKESILGDELTTDDEDIVSFPRSNTTIPAIASATTTALHNPSATGATGLLLPTASSSSDSYYALQADPTYRPLHRAKSPLATHSVDMASSSDMTWDYSETEWWGWIILIVTWLVFVVGMGSCFGVWSWAWDVGETPYAPPELEDDPTLPIVGYYPALIVLTAVMSWVWVIIAWVGMKYFKHANISGEDI